jgi:hypothetical protein
MYREVTVFQTYTPFTPIIGDILGPIQLRASSDMPVEAWYHEPVPTPWR